MSVYVSIPETGIYYSVSCVVGYNAFLTVVVVHVSWPRNTDMIQVGLQRYETTTRENVSRYLKVTDADRGCVRTVCWGYRYVSCHHNYLLLMIMKNTD